MTARPRLFRLDAPARERWMAVGAVMLAASGIAVALAGAAMRDLTVALGGSAAVAAALVVLVAGRWVNGLICVTIALPLPPIYDSETLRVSPAGIVTLAVLAGWAIARGLERRPLALGRLPRWSTAALMGSVLLSAAFAEHLGPALREVISMATILGLLVAATDELRARPETIRPLLWTIVVVNGLSGALALLQALGAPPRQFPLAGTAFYRANLGFAGPTELGMFMALGIPFAAYLWRTARGRGARALAGACLMAGALGLAATFSRGSWLALIGGALVLILARQSRYAVQIWLAVLLVAVVVQVISGGALVDRFTSAAGLATIDQRVALMMVGLLIFQAHPLLGVGPGGFPAALTRFGPQVPGLWDYVGAAHNAYVHIAAECGIVGFVALVAFMGTSLFVLVRAVRAGGRAVIGEETPRLQRTVAWAFAMACAMGLVEWIFVHGVGELIMLIAAVGLALDNRAPA